MKIPLPVRIQGWEVNYKAWETNKLKETDF